MNRLSFVWLEITGKCQLECVHCYAESGPGGNHGNMGESDWLRAIDQTADLGVRMVQFIGGEPTLHPSLPTLVDQVLAWGIEVEVYTNLVHVRPALWDSFAQPGVHLATSYYSCSAEEHASITRRPSYERTKANIREAIRRSIPLRVGVVNLAEGQRSDRAIEELREIGVTDIGTDNLRQVGRGVRADGAGLDQLCGHCGTDKVAVSPTGEVWPCVFARWMPVGNVREQSLGEILSGSRMTEADRRLRAHFEATTVTGHGPDFCGPENCPPETFCGPGRCPPAISCGPKDCEPRKCFPNKCGPYCGPKRTGEASLSAFGGPVSSARASDGSPRVG